MEGKSSTCEFESFISPTFCQRDGIGRRVRLRSGCLYGVEGSSPSAGISYDRILQRRMTIRLHASFAFVVLGEDSGIFRDTRTIRQGMLKEQSLSYSNIRKLEDMMASKSFCKGSKFSYIGLDEVELPVSERSEYPRFFRPSRRKNRVQAVDRSKL